MFQQIEAGNANGTSLVENNDEDPEALEPLPEQPHEHLRHTRPEARPEDVGQ